MESCPTLQVKHPTRGVIKIQVYDSPNAFWDHTKHFVNKVEKWEQHFGANLMAQIHECNPAAQKALCAWLQEHLSKEFDRPRIMVSERATAKYVSLQMRAVIACNGAIVIIRDDIIRTIYVPLGVAQDDGNAERAALRHITRQFCEGVYFADGGEDSAERLWAYITPSNFNVPSSVNISNAAVTLYELFKTMCQKLQSDPYKKKV